MTERIHIDMSKPRKRGPGRPITSDPKHPVVRRRLALRLTQEQLAAKAGLAWITITSVERGKMQPRTGTIRKLAAALECDAAQLAQELVKLQFAEEG